MPERSSEVEKLLDATVAETVRLVREGKIDELKKFLARCFPNLFEEDTRTYDPGDEIHHYRLLIGKLVVGHSGSPYPVQILMAPEAAKRELSKFYTLSGMLNASAAQNDLFPDADGKTAHAKDMPVADLGQHFSDVILTRMDGNIRVEDAPQVRLD